ncbi:MAG: CorA family divalent cation transporter [Acholeplasmataceae bacterium]
MKFKTYFIPKSFVYTGKFGSEKTTIKHYQFDKKDVTISDTFDSDPALKHYIQVVGLSDVEAITNLTKHFTVDPLILEDIFNVKQRDKIELQDKHLFGVFHIHYIKEAGTAKDYMSMLLFENALITFHEKEPVFLESLTHLITQHKETKEKTIDFLFYEIIDMITDHHIEVYDALEEKMSLYEEEILESKQTNQEAFYQTRKTLLKLKNSVTPILEQLTTTLNKKPPLIHASLMPYFDDLKDHLNRLDLQLTQARELMRHLLDLQMNNQSNKMNQIMTTLTLFSAIFIPLSFLTGFFGMNFIHFGILAYENAIMLFVAFCLLIGVGMFALFKKMKWL